MQNKHTLIKKYLEQHSLVESNLRSFNNFIQHRMQSIVGEVNRNIEQEDVEVKLGKIRVGKPDVIEAQFTLIKF